MGWDAPWHWVVLAILVIALFGYKKLPDAARSVGRSLRIFKTEIKGMGEDDKKRESADVAPRQIEATSSTPPAAPVAPATPVTPGTTESAQPPVNVNGSMQASPVGDQSTHPGSSAE
jgi:sec-independent protein translocase protein TatA